MRVLRTPACSFRARLADDLQLRERGLAERPSAGAASRMICAGGAGACAGVPFPVRATVCGVVAELSATESVAPRSPLASGANTTSIAQLAAGATVTPLQPSLATWKSPASVPPVVAAVGVRAAVPWLVIVTVCAAEVVPT